MRGAIRARSPIVATMAESSLELFGALSNSSASSNWGCVSAALPSLPHPGQCWLFFQPDRRQIRGDRSPRDSTGASLRALLNRCRKCAYLRLRGVLWVEPEPGRAGKRRFRGRPGRQNPSYGSPGPLDWPEGAAGPERRSGPSVAVPPAEGVRPSLSSDLP